MFTLSKNTVRMLLDTHESPSSLSETSKIVPEATDATPETLKVISKAIDITKNNLHIGAQALGMNEQWAGYPEDSREYNLYARSENNYENLKNLLSMLQLANASRNEAKIQQALAQYNTFN